jgi:hypothetical protein
MLINKLIKIVKDLDLNLKDKVVLTEAASGPYIVTPIIAAIAGAKVFAYSKTTSYGTKEEIFRDTKILADLFTDFKLNIHFIDELSEDVMSEIDIITNSGHLRPLNEDLLKYAKDDVVISLMYEGWEWRDSDLDLDYIRKRGIKLGATNERHSSIDVFNYLGYMALKQLFDAGMSVYRNKFILICNNDFGPFIAKVIARISDGVAVIDLDENKLKYDDSCTWIGGFPNVEIPTDFKDSEAVIFSAYPFDKLWIGNDTDININQLKDQLTTPFIIRYEGDVDCEVLKENNVFYFPEFVRSGHMGILPSAIGFDPTIRLQAGGLKVGEALLTGNHEFNGEKLLEII